MAILLFYAILVGFVNSEVLKGSGIFIVGGVNKAGFAPAAQW